MTSPVEKMTFGEYATSPNHLSDIENHEDVWREAASKSGVPVNDFKGLYKVDEYDEDGWRMDPLWYQKNPKEMFGYISPKKSKWKKAEKKKKKHSNKHQTSLKDHRRSVQKYGPLKTHNVRNFKKRSVLNSEQAQELFGEDPYMYHDVAAARTKSGQLEHISTIDSIFKNGILPKEKTGVAEYDDWLTSRPDHVYLGKHDFYSRRMIPALRINMSKVDPSKLAPDEDLFPVFGYNSNYSDLMDFHGIKSPPFEKEQPEGSTLGNWAHEHSHLDTPKNVKASRDLIGSVAVNGGVPSDATEFNPMWLDQVKDEIQQEVEAVEGGIEDADLKIQEHILSFILAHQDKLPHEVDLYDFIDLYNKIHEVRNNKKQML
jgi:hypothetical protein